VLKFSSNFPARGLSIAIFSSVSLRLEFQVLFQMMRAFRVLHSISLGESLQIDSIVSWEFREEFSSVNQGILFVIAQVCRGFSPVV
jgi:hypothetical protein